MTTALLTHTNRDVEILKAVYARAYVAHRAVHSTHGVSNGAGGYNQRDKSGRTVWEKIVDHARDQHVSPCTLVAVLFGTWESKQSPRPHHLLGRHVLQNLKAYGRRMHEDVLILLQTDRQAFNIALSAVPKRKRDKQSPYAQHVTVLANDFLQLSPLFRYCLARRLQAKEIYESLRDAADEQFLSYPPAYLTEWQSLLLPRHLNMGKIYSEN